MVDIRFAWVERFRQIYGYAVAHGFHAGLPTFHQIDYGNGIVQGHHLFTDKLVEWHDVPRDDLGIYQMEDIAGMFRAVNDWAGRAGYAGAFPTFHQANHGSGVVCGVMALKPEVVDFADISRDELGIYHIEDIYGMFRAVNDWAGRAGYAGAFPTFHQADYGRGVVCGAMLLKPGTTQFRDIYADILMMFSIFIFDAGITEEQRNRLLERHSFAYSQISGCNSLTQEQKTKLKETYRKSISHYITTDPKANAEARVLGGDQIGINFGNLFPKGDFEIAQSLIHEMMHCAGYTHPDRRDFDSNNPSAPFDQAGDNGQYYGTPPLQAELCINGHQSLTRTQVRSTCVNENGVFKILSTP